MPVEKCLHAYRVQRLNCAQSVLTGFQSRGVSPAEIAAARAWGGGRAEAGACGALHAALRLAEQPVTRESLRKAFREQAGSETCREIRSAKRLSCSGCVALAAETLAACEASA